jgi:hypothetical protein
MNDDLRLWIDRLGLIPHPEGGYYRETFRSSIMVDLERFEGERELATSIYFLITDSVPSRFHRLRGEEIWNWHAGSALTLHLLDPTSGLYSSVRLGENVVDGDRFQHVVPAGIWFGATVADGFALAGCTVIPGFRFTDFEMGEPEELLARFPESVDVIRRLT